MNKRVLLLLSLMTFVAVRSAQAGFMKWVSAACVAGALAHHAYEMVMGALSAAGPAQGSSIAAFEKAWFYFISPDHCVLLMRSYPVIEGRKCLMQRVIVFNCHGRIFDDHTRTYPGIPEARIAKAELIRVGVRECHLGIQLPAQARQWDMSQQGLVSLYTAALQALAGEQAPEEEPRRGAHGRS